MKVGCEFMRPQPILEVIFMALTENSSVITNDPQGPQVSGHFPDGHIPDGHFPNGHFHDGHFLDGHFPDQTHPRQTLP